MDTELLVARISDVADICEKTARPKFMGFLSPEQSVLAERLLSKRSIKYSFFGGYTEAQRVVLGCFPDWCEDFNFPVTAVTFSYRKSNTLYHKDFLGSLMALGIKRETVGDILIEDGRTVAFLLDEISDYVMSEIRKIGRIGVELKIGFTEPLPMQNELREFTETVASLRLDCVVSAVAGLSRGVSEQKIEDGLVSVNSVVVQKTTKILCDGDILTVRGSGKFIIDSTSLRSKKDRIILKYRKYV